MAETIVTAGIDVSKEWLDCAVWPGKAELRVERNAVGFDRLAAWLVEHRVIRSPADYLAVFVRLGIGGGW